MKVTPAWQAYCASKLNHGGLARYCVFALIAGSAGLASAKENRCRDIYAASFHKDSRSIDVEVIELAELLNQYHSARQSDSGSLETALEGDVANRFTILARILGPTELKERLREATLKLKEKATEFQHEKAHLTAKTEVHPVWDIDLSARPVKRGLSGHQLSLAKDSSAIGEIKITSDGQWTVIRSLNGAIVAHHFPTGKTHDLFPRDGGVRRFVLGPRNDRILVVDQNGDHIVYASRANGEIKLLKRLKGERNVESSGWSADGKQYYFIVDQGIVALDVELGEKRKFRVPDINSSWRISEGCAHGHLAKFAKGLRNGLRNQLDFKFAILDFSTGERRDYDADHTTFAAVDLRARFAAILIRDGELEVIDRVSGATRIEEGEWHQPRFSPNGKMIAISGKDESGKARFEVRNSDTWELLARIPGSSGNFSFAPDNQSLYVFNQGTGRKGANEVLLYDVAKGKGKKTAGYLSNVENPKITFSRDGQTVYLMSESSDERKQDQTASHANLLFAGSGISDLGLYLPAVSESWLNLDHNAAVLGTFAGTSHLLSIPSHQPAKVFDLDGVERAVNAHWNSSGDRVAIGTESGKVKVFDLR